jgi:hypothetical protein
VSLRINQRAPSSFAVAQNYDAAKKILEADKQVRDYQKAQVGGYGYIYDEPSWGPLGIILTIVVIGIAGVSIFLNAGSKKLKEKKQEFIDKYSNYYPLIDVCSKYSHFFLTSGNVLSLNDLKIGQIYLTKKRETNSFPSNFSFLDPVKIKVDDRFCAYRVDYEKNPLIEVQYPDECYLASAMTAWIDVNPKSLYGNYYGDHNLSDANYKLYLQKKYELTKNDVIGGFCIAEKCFSTDTEAFEYCHQKYLKEFNELSEKTFLRNGEQRALFNEFKLKYDKAVALL